MDLLSPTVNIRIVYGFLWTRSVILSYGIDIKKKKDEHVAS